MKRILLLLGVFALVTSVSTPSMAEEILANNCVLSVDYAERQQYVLTTQEENAQGERIKLGAVGENMDGSWYARIENEGRANKRFFTPREAAQYICEYLAAAKKE